MRLRGFCFVAIDSMSGAPNIPLGLNGMILGPLLVTWVFMGSCFAAIDFRSGTPNIPLGFNGIVLGPSVVTWGLMGSVFLPSIPDLVFQTSRWGSTG